MLPIPNPLSDQVMPRQPRRWVRVLAIVLFVLWSVDVLVFLSLELIMVPHFKYIYRSFAAHLPPLTIFYMSLSSALQEGWFWILPATGLAMTGVGALSWRTRLVWLAIWISLFLLLLTTLMNVLLPLAMFAPVRTLVQQVQPQ